jgi:hypothetical protein
MPEAAVQAAHTAKAVGGDALGVVVEYIAPLAGAVVGFVAGPKIVGGGYSISNAISGSAVGSKISTDNIHRIAGLTMAAITSLIGGIFWRLGMHDGWIQRLVGRGLGAFFFGTALSNLFTSGLMGQAPAQGGIDNLVSWVQGTTKGG